MQNHCAKGGGVWVVINSQQLFSIPEIVWMHSEANFLDYNYRKAWLLRLYQQGLRKLRKLKIRVLPLQHWGGVWERWEPAVQKLSFSSHWLGCQIVPNKPSAFHPQPSISWQQLQAAKGRRGAGPQKKTFKNIHCLSKPDDSQAILLREDVTYRSELVLYHQVPPFSWRRTENNQSSAGVCQAHVCSLGISTGYNHEWWKSSSSGLEHSGSRR